MKLWKFLGLIFALAISAVPSLAQNAQRFVLPYQYVADATGVPIPGAKLFFYASGTSTPLATYSNVGLTIPNANPVQANAAGLFPNIFMQPAFYKVVLTDSFGNQIWTADPVANPVPQSIPLDALQNQAGPFFLGNPNSGTVPILALPMGANVATAISKDINASGGGILTNLSAGSTGVELFTAGVPSVGLVPNSSLINSTMDINGTTCTLGPALCTVATALVPGSTPLTGDNGGILFGSGSGTLEQSRTYPGGLSLTLSKDTDQSITIYKTPSPDTSWFGNSFAAPAIVTEFLQDQNLTTDQIAPAWVFEDVITGNGIASGPPDSSSSFWTGLYIVQTKSGNGSGQGFTYQGTLRANGGSGGYNELGGFQFNIANNGSANGHIEGIGGIVGDSVDGGSTHFPTQLVDGLFRLAKYDSTIPGTDDTQTSNITVTSEGTQPGGAIVYASALGPHTWWSGIDFTAAIFESAAIALPNNANVAWENAAGNALLSGIFIDSSDRVEIDFNGGTTIFGGSVQISQALALDGIEGSQLQWSLGGEVWKANVASGANWYLTDVTHSKFPLQVSVNTTATLDIGVTTANVVTVNALVIGSGSSITSSGPGGALTSNAFSSATFLQASNNLSDVANKATAFNNISPLTTAGDILYGGTSGAGTRLAAGTSSQVLIGGTTPSWGAATSAMLNVTTTTCTNQFVTAISSGAVGTCSTATLASAQFANQGTTTTLLHGNAAGNPSWSAVSLTADVTGILAGTNGGTGINNGAKTITLGASLTTTGGAATLALGATGRTYTFPDTTDTVDLIGTAQTYTAAKTFTNSDLLLLGSSTGATTFTSANLSVTNFVATVPAATDTIAELAQTQTLTNKTIAFASNTLTGVASSGANSNITSLSGLTTPLTVAQGGIGAATLTAHAVLLGEGTATLGFATIGTAGRILLDQGSADPVFTAMSGDGVITSAGALTVSKIGGKALTLAAALTTTGGATTLALGATGRTYTFPDASDTVALIGTAQTWTATPTFSNGTYSAVFTGGNVGIGIATPVAPLEIKVATNAHLLVNNNSGAVYVEALNDAYNAVQPMSLAASTLNFVATALQINGTPGVSCASGTVTLLTEVVTNGIVTHC